MILTGIHTDLFFTDVFVTEPLVSGFPHPPTDSILQISINLPNPRYFTTLCTHHVESVTLGYTKYSLDAFLLVIIIN